MMRLFVSVEVDEVNYEVDDVHLCVSVEVDVSLLLDPGKGLPGWSLKQNIPEDNHDHEESGNYQEMLWNYQEIW